MPKRPVKPPPALERRLGVLGGGQLARLLALAAHPLGVRPSVLTPRADDPAARVCGEHHLGAPDRPEATYDFLRTIDVITFESEFIDVAMVERVRPARLAVFPSLAVLGRIQDRLTQKQMLDEFGIATSPWMPVDVREDLPRARARFRRGFVLKARRFGYDGHGTFRVAANARPDPAWSKALALGVIAEELQNFRRELATSFVRSADGTFRALPLVESVQVDARCFSVRGPVDHPGRARLTRQFRQLMDEVGYVGILAVELFDVRGRLLVNELAPRVHNSAHYSQNALTCDQFEYHLRAGLGLPLPPVRLRAPAFAMVNLLGGGGRTALDYSGDGWLHWYGKTQNRPGRKLGHLNVVDRTPRAALTKALRWRKDIRL